MNDEKFVSQLKKGDSEAYNTLISAFSKKLYYLCLKILGNSTDAEDAVQTTFLKVYKGISSFEKRSGLSTWIYKIAINTCNDMLRKKIRENVMPFPEYDSENFFEPADDSESVEDTILRREREKLVYNCIHKLSPGHKKFIVLRDLEGLSYLEISQILNLNIGTVKSGINRARSKLINLIKENGEEI